VVGRCAQAALDLPAAWQSPIGTRIWKEFSFGGRAETHYMVRTPAGWKFAAYVWNADETEAVRVPVGGLGNQEISCSAICCSLGAPTLA
jgi:hypothetical protein